jgi:transcriptional accessory protein Tex/SPT6
MAKRRDWNTPCRHDNAQEFSDPVHEAEAFINEEKGVASVDDALSGARDIIAEWIKEDAATGRAYAVFSTWKAFPIRRGKGQGR